MENTRYTVPAVTLELLRIRQYTSIDEAISDAKKIVEAYDNHKHVTR